MKTSVSKTHKIGIFPNGLVHGFGDKFEILLTFRFIHNTPRKSIWLRSRYKRRFFRQYKHRFKKNAKLLFFQRRYSMMLLKNLKFFLILCLSKIDQEKVFADVLVKKRSLERLPEYLFIKNAKLEFLQRGQFIVLVKNLRFLQLSFLCKRDQEKVFGNVLVRKKFLTSFVTPFHPL